MREIKFRAIRVNTGEFINSMSITKGVIKRKRNNYYFETSPNNWTEVIPKTIGQFTELTDANGKEIYEGDIVVWDTTEAYHKPIKEVNWNNEFAAWCFGNMPIHKVFESGYYQPSCGRKPYPGEGFEVLGNIHKNIELLTP